MNDWKPKPGDVGMIRTTSGDAEVLAIRDTHGWAYLLEYKSDQNAHARWTTADMVTVVRPLVVIDPEDREAVERLLCLFHQQERTTPEGIANLQQALREFAAPKPPRPDEPTNLYAVVRDEGGDEWCHIGGQVWRSLTSTGQFMVEKHWRDAGSPLAESAVEVIAEGRP